MLEQNSIKISDVKGVIPLVKEATLNITDLVEDVHNNATILLPIPTAAVRKSVRGISHLVFNQLRFATKVIAFGLDKSLNLLPSKEDEIEHPSQLRDRALAVLNGIIGDHLEKTENALALQMEFRFEGTRLSFDSESISNKIPKVSSKIVLMIHGSCMSASQWKRNGHCHGEQLAVDSDCTVLYLNYNSGLHISENGDLLSLSLANLINAWPVELQEISIIAHSMGGLVARSAIDAAASKKASWLNNLKKVFFLGTPHHGAPLERVGNFIDRSLESFYFLKPFSRLGKIRSAGLTDLRFGNILKEEWEGRDRFKTKKDQRLIVPLNERVLFYFVAACLGDELNKMYKKVIGDGLVPVNSAMGKHLNKERSLNFRKDNQYIIYRSDHLDLLNSKKVYDFVKSKLISL